MKRFSVSIALTLLYCASPTNALAGAPGQSAPTKKFFGGAGVGRFTLDGNSEKWKCAYDMILVERIQGKPKTASGLFVPEEDLPKLHLCKGKLIALLSSFFMS